MMTFIILLLFALFFLVYYIVFVFNQTLTAILLFVSHSLFAIYELGKLSMPYLYATEGSRLGMVSSGGMYNGKFPSWNTANVTWNTNYDRRPPYAYAKRGLTRIFSRLTIISSFCKSKIITSFLSSHS